MLTQQRGRSESQSQEIKTPVWPQPQFVPALQTLPVVDWVESGSQRGPAGLRLQTGTCSVMEINSITDCFCEDTIIPAGLFPNNKPGPSETWSCCWMKEEDLQVWNKDELRVLITLLMFSYTLLGHICDTRHLNKEGNIGSVLSAGPKSDSPYLNCYE